MYINCYLLLFVFGLTVTAYDFDKRCSQPKLENGRYRIRPRSKIIKFICNTGYELVGNRYATCRGSTWDVPIPVCVKSGCPIESIKNGVYATSMRGASILYFCMTNYKLVGQDRLNCNGVNWDHPYPTCVSTTEAANLTCDFEDPGLCGWKQDEMHDFDWIRHSNKTPSSYFFTGPSYDHTYGPNKTGYYMYIESTSKLENDTARLISPVYKADLTLNGCFSFSYHMYGKYIGGLRVYQKPDNVRLSLLLDYVTDTVKQKYILFERWGNIDNNWYTSVTPLRNMSDDFQIIIEGIRGRSFVSDIAIDDVAILQGENCTAARKNAVTPLPDASCNGRCTKLGESEPREAVCGCNARCIILDNCCPDYFETCVFGAFDTDATEETLSTLLELPQTQKLVSATAATINETTTEIIIPSTTKIPRTTPKPTTKTTTTSTTTTTTRRTTKDKTTTPTTTIRTTAKPKARTPSTKVTIRWIPTKKTTTSPVPRITTTNRNIYDEEITKKRREQLIEDRSSGELKISIPDRSGMSGTKITLIVIVVVLCSVGAAWLAVELRGSRGLSALAKFRGSVNRDTEVRYLNAEIDEE